MVTDTRPGRYEIWSCSESGHVHKHGAAFGATFEDACKHLASESIDFWTHYERGRYQGRPVYPSRREALAAVESDEPSGP